MKQDSCDVDIPRLHFKWYTFIWCKVCDDLLTVRCLWQVVMPTFQNNVFTLLSNINMPGQESELNNFMVQQGGQT